MATVATHARPARDKPVLATCRTCGLDLPTTYFRHAPSHGKRYRHPDCRVCQRQRRAAAIAQGQAGTANTDSSTHAARAAVITSLRDELAHYYARAIAAGHLTQAQAMANLQRLKHILDHPDPATQRKINEWPVAKWAKYLEDRRADGRQADPPESATR